MTPDDNSFNAAVDTIVQYSKRDIAVVFAMSDIVEKLYAEAVDRATRAIHTAYPNLKWEEVTLSRYPWCDDDCILQAIGCDDEGPRSIARWPITYEVFNTDETLVLFLQTHGETTNWR